MVSNKPPSHRFPCHFTHLSPIHRLRPYSAQALHAYTHKSSRSLTSVLYPVTPCTTMYRNTQQKTFTTQTTRSPSCPDMATCIGRCLSKSGIIEQGSKFSFSPYFREVPFCDSVFRRTVRSGWSGRREVLPGGAASPLPILWVGLLFTSPLLGGAAFLSLLWEVVLSPSALQAVFFFFLKKKNTGSSPTQRRERKAARPQGGGGQAAPPAREGRESSTTEREEEGPPLNWTELNCSRPC